MSRKKFHFRPQTVFLVVLLWTAVLIAALPEILALEDPRLRLLLGALATAVLAVGWWAGKRRQKRIETLTAVLKEIRDGDYSKRSQIPGVGPLAELSEAVDAMAEHIENNMGKLEADEQRVRKLAYHDALTELPNRRFFEELMARELSQAKRTDSTVGIVIVDLDHFKDVNDSLGHAYGDLLLVETARRLSDIVRQTDLVARLGGDEFALLLTRAKEPKELLIVIHRLHKAFREPFQLDSKEVHTSVSMGASFFPQDGKSSDELIRNADTALYQAKRKGRNKVQLFDSSRNHVVHRRLQLEQDLRQALESEQLILHYQPLVKLADDEVIGFEALCRWQHPKAGLIMPNRFIPMAEETGLMPMLGSQVLSMAGRQLAEWRAQKLAAVPISLNVSLRQFQAGDFVDQVRQALEEFDIPPDLVQVEVTENIAIENAEKLLEFISALHDLGVLVAIDDFGTGYSSFSYLREYGIKTVKIDRSFVAGLPNDRDSVAIVKAIISLAKNLDLQVIAEGIETEAQLEMLRECGCDVGQGYLLGSPLPAEEHHLALLTGHLPPIDSKAVI